MSRTQWAQEREERRAFAIAQGAVPTAEAFRSWAFRDHPEMVAIAQGALASATPEPDADALSRALAPTPPGMAEPATRRTHDASLQGLDQVAHTPLNHRAWCIAELDLLGAEIQDRERNSWTLDWQPNPERDSQCSAIWASLVSGDPWALREPCEALWLEPASRSFAAVLAAREVPRPVARRAQQDLREAFFYRLLGDGVSTPGWAELAVRVLETVGPVTGPAATLSSSGLTSTGDCLSRRAGWSKTINPLFPDLPDRAGRALALERLAQDPQMLEAMLDLHVALRFLDTLPSDRPAAWRLVTQNRGKARGRLRAVVAQNPTWLPALLSLDALDARTRVAVSRYAWSWAWQELSHDFSFDPGRPTTPPCTPPEPGLDPLAHDLDGPLQTWVLLVMLKGRHGHLERWVRTGGTGDRDSTWARLLLDLPPRVLDTDGGYRRVRIHLHDALARYREAHTDVVGTLAGLPINRKLKALVLDCIRPGWSAEVPLPRSGFPTFVEHARAILPLLEVDPCP